MCNWQEEAMGVFSRIGASNLENVFPEDFIQRFPPGAVRAGRCLGCGRLLSYQEMFPSGKTPRYMCEVCYGRIAFCGPKQSCLTCGGPLSPGQIRAQMQNPRELTHALHPGACKDYHAALAGIVLGIPFRTNPVALLPRYANEEPQQFNRSLPSRQRLLSSQPLRSQRYLRYLRLPDKETDES
jgi:hypothetical protein